MTGKGGNRQNMNYVGTCQDLDFWYNWAKDKNKDGMLSPEELKELWSLVQYDENTKRLSENEMDDIS